MNDKLNGQKLDAGILVMKSTDNRMTMGALLDCRLFCNFFKICYNLSTSISDRETTKSNYYSKLIFKNLPCGMLRT